MKLFKACKNTKKIMKINKKYKKFTNSLIKKTSFLYLAGLSGICGAGPDVVEVCFFSILFPIFYRFLSGFNLIILNRW
jgi:hypothetical protein